MQLPTELDVNIYLEDYLSAFGTYEQRTQEIVLDKFLGKTEPVKFKESILDGSLEDQLVIAVKEVIKEVYLEIAGH